MLYLRMFCFFLLLWGGIANGAPVKNKAASQNDQLPKSELQKNKSKDSDSVSDTGGMKGSSTDKTRQGSILKRNKPLEDPPDLRGAHEVKRDKELALHYKRLAELDVIAQLADKDGDSNLAELCESVRRKELVRFRLVLQSLFGNDRGTQTGSAE